jgi:hypothetical protein
MKANHPMNDGETAASLNGRAKTDAQRALRVLAEAAEPVTPEETETPPLPAPLRELWQETYGENPAAAPAPVATREGWLLRLARFFKTPRAAWAGGLAAAAAAIVVMMHNPEPAAVDPGGRVVTRGGPLPGAGDNGATRLIVVAAADKAGPLLAELARAFPSRPVERVDSVPLKISGDAIIIDAAARHLQRPGQPPAATLSGDPLTNPQSVIMAIEVLDEPEPR